MVPRYQKEAIFIKYKVDINRLKAYSPEILRAFKDGIILDH